MSLKIIYISNCSNRKSIKAKKAIKCADQKMASLETFAKNWCKKIAEQDGDLKIDDLYTGRSAKIAKDLDAYPNITRWYISAGLGLKKSGSKVPNYDLTVTPNTENSFNKKIIGPASTSDWWLALNSSKGNKKPLRTLINRNKDKLIVLAISSSYLEMVSEELLEVVNAEHLRIIGPTETAIPDELKHLWMPYTTNFDGPDSPNPGTVSDYAQRVGSHFCLEIASSRSITKPRLDAKKVGSFCANLKPIVNVSRTQATDQQIIKLIRKNWNAAEGRSARMLRILRDNELVSCEQGRFKNLFNEYKETRND